MQPLPHEYRVSVSANELAPIVVTSSGVPNLATDTPPEFGGGGSSWSPETLLVAAVVDCYALTFRGLAARSKLAWETIECDATGTLDKVDGVTQFVRMDLRVRLRLRAGASHELARRLVSKAEDTCLIARSLTARTVLHCAIEHVPAQAA